MSEKLTEARRRSTLAEMDGLLIVDSQLHPHPVELARWSNDGLIELDLARGVYRLTAHGREHLKKCCLTA